MNVLLANLNYKPHKGGIENSFFYISQELKSQKHNVVIIAGDKTLSGEGRLPEFELIDGIEVYRFKRLQTKIKFLKIFANIIDVLQSYLITKKLSKKYKFEKAILRDSKVGIGAVWALKKTKNIYVAPAVSALQDKKPLDEFSGMLFTQYFKWLYYYIINVRQNSFFQKYLLKTIDFIYVFSENMQTQLLTLSPKIKGKIRLIKPGVDHQVFGHRHSLEKENLRDVYSISKEAFVFLILGRVIKVKGISYAIEALSRINRKDVILVIVGDGPEVDNLKELSKRLEIHSRTQFYSSTTEPNVFYELSDAFIMSSTYEPFGQTILEAMASALPVIGFKPDGVNVMTATDQIVSDDINGFLCDFTIDSLSEGMKKAVELSPEIRIGIGKYNRQIVMEQYSWKNFCDQILA